ncbi:restriction endonuclease subunit S [Shewanella algae]|uniref:restriction endonuclease subunit S n=1 Tax=Shewanella algae TaxID=38313 RepID=UPI00399B6286
MSNQWAFSSLGCVGRFQAGYGFPIEYQGKDSGDLPFAKVGDISATARRGQTYIHSAGNYVDRSELPILKAKTIPEGSIVFAKIGEAIRQNFRAIAAQEMLIDNNSMALIPDLKKVDTGFLYHFMCQLDLYQYTGATTVPAIRKSTLEEIKIPLPPLAEQKRIAAILDKADALRRKRLRAIELADQFLRSVFLDMFGDPVTNPKGWNIFSLVNGIQSIDSGWSANGDNTPATKEQLGVLKISAVTSGIFRPEENKAVDIQSVPAGKKLLKPRAGDLLFSRANTRELVAATAIVNDDYDNLFLPDKLWRVSTNEKLMPEFLHFLLKQPRMRDRLTSQATGTSGSMLNISKKKFEETPAIFPPAHLQRRFAEIYRKSGDFIALDRDSAEELHSLFSSLSQQAFSGKL